MHISDGVFIMSIGSEAPSRRRRYTEKKKKRKAEHRAARLRIEGLPLGAVLQELDFNPLKSISTVEKRDPGERKRKYRKQERKKV